MPTDQRYFDYAATTPLDPVVLDAMLPFFQDQFANPSSVHRGGQRAEAAVEESRVAVGKLIGSRQDELVFTSGATESNNLVLRGIARQRQQDTGAARILTTRVEHPSVLQTCRDLESRDGFLLDFLPLDDAGRVDISAVPELLTDDTALVSVVYANNEIGTINPIAEVGSLCRQRAIPFHTDGAQAANHLPLNVDELNVDYLTLGAHKFYGPKGVGVLYHRRGKRLPPAQTGGEQEFGTRAGTHNVPGIVGFARALELARSQMKILTPQVMAWRDQIIDDIETNIPDARITGHRHQRLANHVSFALKDIESNQLIAALDLAGFACSSASACKTGNPEPSPILLALGFTSDWAMGALRITLGRGTTQEWVDDLLSEFPEIVERLRAQPVGQA